MGTQIDPEGVETAALFAAADFHRARVLEIGCGAGRLTRRYASVSRRVVGIDPLTDSLITARRDRPAHRRGDLQYLQASALALPFAGANFDIVLFGWSL
jgi:ubiquinone/menaquinone biosynthesis C-methylase UbiE